MFLKQLDNMIRNVSLAARIVVEERRSGVERRQLSDRRAEARYGEGTERRITPDRREQPLQSAERPWYESLGNQK